MKLGENVDVVAPLNVKTAEKETGYLLLNPAFITNGKITGFENAEVPDRYKSGETGGELQKVQACQECGVGILTIKRPVLDYGTIFY